MVLDLLRRSFVRAACYSLAADNVGKPARPRRVMCFPKSKKNGSGRWGRKAINCFRFCGHVTLYNIDYYSGVGNDGRPKVPRKARVRTWLPTFISSGPLFFLSFFF
jgi:hypothetical protein